MIVDTPITVDLALGTERRVIDQGDAQVLIPPSVQPVALFLLPTLTSPPATVPMETSAIRSNTRSNTNQAASSDVLLQLAAGFWELEIWLDSTANFTHGFVAGTDTGVRITLETLAALTLHPLIQRYVVQNFSAHDYTRLRVLLREPLELVHRVQVTGVGQSILSAAVVNAIRIL